MTYPPGRMILFSPDGSYLPGWPDTCLSPTRIIAVAYRGLLFDLSPAIMIQTRARRFWERWIFSKIQGQVAILRLQIAISTIVTQPGLHGIHHLELLANNKKRRSTVRSPEEEKKVARTINRIRERMSASGLQRKRNGPRPQCRSLWAFAKQRSTATAHGKRCDAF
jgi:hypothetical protein